MEMQIRVLQQVPYLRNLDINIQMQPFSIGTLKIKRDFLKIKLYASLGFSFFSYIKKPDFPFTCLSTVLPDSPETATDDFFDDLWFLVVLRIRIRCTFHGYGSSKVFHTSLRTHCGYRIPYLLIKISSGQIRSASK